MMCIPAEFLQQALVWRHSENSHIWLSGDGESRTLTSLGHWFLGPARLPFRHIPMGSFSPVPPDLEVDA